MYTPLTLHFLLHWTGVTGISTCDCRVPNLGTFRRKLRSWVLVRDKTLWSRLRCSNESSLHSTFTNGFGRNDYIRRDLYGDRYEDTNLFWHRLSFLKTQISCWCITRGWWCTNWVKIVTHMSLFIVSFLETKTRQMYVLLSILVK